MKRIYNFITSKPIWVLLAIISIVFLPSAIAAESEGVEELVVKSFGIDKIGEEYELSTLAYVPQAATTFSENYQIFSAKGDTVFEAISNLSKIVGKNIELAHSNLILLNNEMCESGILHPLEYLIREYSLGNNSLVFNTEDIPCKEVLEVGKNIAKGKGISLQDIGDFNNKRIFAPCFCLEKIFSESLSPNKIAMIGSLTLKEDEGIKDDGEQSSGGSGGGTGEGETGGGSSSSGQQQNNKKLANTGDTTIFKEGKKIFSISYKEMLDFSWGKNRRFFGTFELKDYSDNIFTKADLTFFIDKSNVKIKTKVENGTPICNISINPELILHEVIQKSVEEKFYPKTFHLDDSQIIKNINKKIGMDFSKVLKKTIDYNADLLDVYDIFYSNNNKDFKKYLETLEDEDDYLSKIEFRINVDAKIVE